MDQHQEQNALKSFLIEQKNNHLRCAVADFDALDKIAATLTSSERYDQAYGIFGAFKDWLVDFESETGVYVTDEEFAAVWLRVAPHVTERVAVDLLGERFAEDKHLRLPGDVHVTWHSGNYEAIVARPGETVMYAHDHLVDMLARRATPDDARELADGAPSAFCAAHPSGSALPCARCGTARRARAAWVAESAS